MNCEEMLVDQVQKTTAVYVPSFPFYSVFFFPVVIGTCYDSHTFIHDKPRTPHSNIHRTHTYTHTHAYTPHTTHHTHTSTHLHHTQTLTNRAFFVECGSKIITLSVDDSRPHRIYQHGAKSMILNALLACRVPAPIGAGTPRQITSQIHNAR